MADLTNMESKLGEVVGLAMGAQEATQKVAKLAKDEGKNDLVAALEQMHDEAAGPRTAAPRLPTTFDGKKTAILDEAREVKQKAQR